MFERKLGITSFTLASATVGALLMGILALFAITGAGVPIVDALSSLMIGYEASAAGFFLGIVWGFGLGGILGFVFSYLYNTML